MQKASGHTEYAGQLHPRQRAHRHQVLHQRLPLTAMYVYYYTPIFAKLNLENVTENGNFLAVPSLVKHQFSTATFPISKNTHIYVDCLFAP